MNLVLALWERASPRMGPAQFSQTEHYPRPKVSYSGITHLVFVD
ncbi:hypothetical protein PRJ_4018 [Pseudomonas sp. XWY-1]|nr:hypothetical protein PRJ_4018 [Pseudomonas sp. XWY-1]